MDTTKSGNADGVQAVKRIELAFGDIEVKFIVNPSEYQQREPNKATLTHTKGGAWIDAWGAGVLEFHIRGITGGHRGDRAYRNWIKLRDCIRAVYASVQDGQPITEYLRLYNYTDHEYWHCWPMPNGLELTRSKSNPLLYQYSLSLWGLSRIGETVNSANSVLSSSAASSSGLAGSKSSVGSFSENEKYKVAEGDSLEYWKRYADMLYRVSNADYEVIRRNLYHAIGEERAQEVLEWFNAQQVTNTETVSTVSGGDAYVTTGYSVPDTVTSANVTVYTRSQESLVSECAYLAGILKPLVGGDNGKLAPAAAFFIVNGISLDENGNAFIKPSQFSTGVALSGLQPPSSGSVSILQSEMSFSPVVSKIGSETYKSIKSCSSSVLSQNFSGEWNSSGENAIVSEAISSENANSDFIQELRALELENGISPQDIGRLRITVIDFMALYLELSRYSQYKTFSVSKTSVNSLAKNTEALILHFADSGNASTNEDDSALIAYILRRFYTVAILIEKEIAPYA